MALGTRLSGTLPVSVAAHLSVLGLLFVVPLLADMTLPRLAVTAPAYVRALPVPAAPSVARGPKTRTTSSRPSVNTDAAPIGAPREIVPERSSDSSGWPVVGVELGTGVPADVGVIVPERTRVVEPSPPAASPTVRVAELPQPPRKLVDVRPVYPEIARTARVQGTVILEAVIDRTGRVENVRVIRSAPLLDQAATDAVRQWRYAPSTLRGQPVAVLMTITVNFWLQ